MVFAEGVDYSSTANGNWNALAAALRAAGKTFAGRYAVWDKSPGGRGITAAEYQALTAHGVEVFLYYEETAGWMLDGWDAGVRAATRAMDVIRSEGLPEGMPVYYSHDVDPEVQHFAAIDDCLRGAASVVGIERVGFYGGWLGIDHVMAARTARWFCQTIAWEYGRGVHPRIHLHQYNTGTNLIGGTNCDFVAALQPHYGQASDFTGAPPKPTKPVYAKRVPIPGPVEPKIIDGIIWLPLHKKRWTARRATERRQYAQHDAALVGKDIQKGDVVTFAYAVFNDDALWFVNAGGTRARADAFIGA